MSLIKSEGAARRLARAIVADLKLYNAGAIEAGSDMTDEFQEGRELFHTRVDVALHPVFEEALGEAGLGAGEARLRQVVETQAEPRGASIDP